MNALDRFSLADRVAVVTGATRGLGAGFAHALGDAGASVVLVGRDAAAAADVLDSLRGNNIRADFVGADVTVPRTCSASWTRRCPSTAGSTCWSTTPAPASTRRPST